MDKLNTMSKIGIFPGSFDPFTIGHADIVRRALPLLDSLVIAVGVNERKQGMSPATLRAEVIASLYAEEPRVKVVTYKDLTTDLAHREGARYIIKGVRSVKDFEYEREQAEINRMIGDVDTIFLFADPSLSSVSSSMVRELSHFGKDVTPFIPTRETIKSKGK